MKPTFCGKHSFQSHVLNHHILGLDTWKTQEQSTGYMAVVEKEESWYIQVELNRMSCFLWDILHKYNQFLAKNLFLKKMWRHVITVWCLVDNILVIIWHSFFFFWNLILEGLEFWPTTHCWASVYMPSSNFSLKKMFSKSFLCIIYFLIYSNTMIIH